MFTKYLKLNMFKHFMKLEKSVNYGIQNMNLYENMHIYQQI